MAGNDTNPYRIEESGGKYRVEDRAGNCVLECRGKANAEHYVDLLNKAYHKGYKAGYRAGRGS